MVLPQENGIGGYLDVADVRCRVADVRCEWAKDFSPLHGVPFGIFRVGICHIRDKRNNNPSAINAVGAKNLSPIRNELQHRNEYLPDFAKKSEYSQNLDAFALGYFFLTPKSVHGT